MEKDTQEDQQHGSDGENKNDKKKPGRIQLTRRGLYAREEPAGLKARQEELHKLGITRHQRDLEGAGDTLASTKYKNLALRRALRLGKTLRFTGMLLLVIIIVVWVVVVLMWYRSRVTVTDDQVGLTIDAPIEFTAGEEIFYKIMYKNKSRVAWQNVELVFNTPRGFNFSGSNQEVSITRNSVVWRVGDIASGAEGEFHVRGLLIGEQNETATGKVDILVTPENFPSGRFLKSTVLATTITALPLEVALDIPKDAASGERVLASISVRNLSNHSLEGVYLKLRPAENIELSTDDIDFTSGYLETSKEWRLQSLDSLESGDFTFVFYVTGQPGEARIIDVEAGIRQKDEEFTQRELTYIVTVSASEVLVKQTYNESLGPIVVKAGDTVQGKVHYSNVGTVGLKDVIVKVKFEGIGFFPSSLQFHGGAYDSAKKTVMWSAATVPELAILQPQQGGEISYSFTVLPTHEYPEAGEGAKNNVIVSVATVDSPDIPTPVGGQKSVVSDRAVLSVETDLSLDVDAFYDDGRLGLNSEGPLPPKVGETTSYTVRFRVGSSLNDVSEARVVAVFPDGVRFTGKSYKTNGEMMFNDRTGELIWSIPYMEGGVGRVRPPQELHVQVEITPGEQLVDHDVSFLNKATIEATDQFVDQEVSVLTKDFPTTKTAVPGRGIVE